MPSKLTAEDQEIMDFLRSEQVSYYRGDFEAFVDHWHHGPEVRRIISGPQPGTRIHVGWDELRAKFEEGFRQFPQNFDAKALLRWDNLQIVKSGEMAWVSYDQIALRNIPGMHVSPFAHETKIIWRIDGKWKLVCLIVIAPGIERQNTPRIELDNDGKVASVNEMGRARLAEHAGLVVSASRLRALQKVHDPELQSAIEACKQRLATNLPRGYLDSPEHVVMLGEDDSGHALFCWVTIEQERILVTFDNTHLLQGRLQRAAEGFALSPAQLRLAELLAAGDELSEAAEKLGISVNTVRTQVRRMFDKTNTHNRAGLITQLLNAHGPRT